MPGLLSDTERLRRVFELELKNECANRVVEGGLDRMFIQMHEEGLLEIGGPLRQRVKLLPAGGYRSLPPEHRQEWIEGTLRALAVPVSVPARAPVPLRRPPPARGSASRSGAARPGPRAVNARPAEREESSHSGPGLSLDAPVSRLPGIGKAAEAKFEKLGVHTAGDAVFLFPRRFNDFTEMRRIAELAPSGLPQTIVGNIFSIREMRFGRRVKGAEALVTDGSGTLRVAWFNMPYVVRQLEEGTRVVFSGKVRAFRGRLQMENPEFEPVDDEAANAGRLVPVYPATQGLSQRMLRRAVKAAVDALSDRVVDAVPGWLREQENLPQLAPAIRALHFPNSFGEAEEARRRLALGEFLAIQAAVLMRRAEWQQGQDAPPLALGERLGPFLEALPFRLTGTQRECLDDILDDIKGPAPMLRLLQGDVGSGKTVVAFGAMLAAVHSGMQAVLMAPTEILADQHYRSFAKLLGAAK
ncbi:MAG: DEAD/DEAH box helicase [Thermoflexaceae bacterium]|nr:DEAD/DEAH box helicase [Thermoflexaceae bacterium]